MKRLEKVVKDERYREVEGKEEDELLGTGLLVFDNLHNLMYKCIHLQILWLTGIPFPIEWRFVGKLNAPLSLFTLLLTWGSLNMYTIGEEERELYERGKRQTNRDEDEDEKGDVL